MPKPHPKHTEIRRVDSPSLGPLDLTASPASLLGKREAGPDPRPVSKRLAPQTPPGRSREKGLPFGHQCPLTPRKRPRRRRPVLIAQMRESEDHDRRDEARRYRNAVPERSVDVLRWAAVAEGAFADIDQDLAPEYFDRSDGDAPF